MIHFRLRRSLRLTVDLLSLYFAGSSIGPRSAQSILRGLHANAPTIRHNPDLPDLYLHLARRSSDAISRSRNRRYFASSGLLLAFSLEICGCNPVKDNGLASSLPTPEPVMRETGLPEQNLSFYDPAEPADLYTSTTPPVSDRLIDTQPAPLDAKPLPWAIPESVYFIYKGRHNGELRPRQPAVATAFVLSIPDRTHNRFIRFLVTARHVVDPEWAHCSERNPSSMDVRLNRRAGGVGYETIPLQSGNLRRFITPSDPTADLAVIPLDQSLIAGIDDYKFIDVPFRMLPTDSETQLVRPDQPIMTAGLAKQSSAQSSNYPVFDAGIISKMPSEAVNVQCGAVPGPQSSTQPLHVWFISAGVPRGVSGAPVYAAIARGAETMKTPVLVGIQSVAWPDRGITGITPSPVLRDLIQSALQESKLNMDFYKGPNP